MKKITYEEAAQLINVKYNTISQAVRRGKLTRCATNTKNALLLEDQVKLFKDKPGIGTVYLNPDELLLWHELKKIAEDSVQVFNYTEKPANDLNEQIIRQLAKQIVSNQVPGDELRKISNLVDQLRNQIDRIMPQNNPENFLMPQA